MRPVRLGDRGPAVEDIQRRLLALGHDIGPTGIDGVFLGKTAEAVRAFQQSLKLDEDGIVGRQTWAALVDASFTFGDRMLYLRLPHYHGRDVLLLQEALNALGFACGVTDGIFGAYTERAVREFQRNAGLPSDGIVGPGTAGTIKNLRHVWEGKGGKPHSEARVAPARAAEVLSRVALAVRGDDEFGRRVAERVSNLALATTDLARMRVLGAAAHPESGWTLIRLCGTDPDASERGIPHVRMGDPELLVVRLQTALATLAGEPREIVLEVEGDAVATELEEQRAAVRVLDALCAAFD